jgi:hypothetical protein
MNGPVILIPPVEYDFCQCRTTGDVGRNRKQRQQTLPVKSKYYPTRFHRWIKLLFGPVSFLELNISLKLRPWILGRGLRTPSKARRLVRGNTRVPVL